MNESRELKRGETFWGAVLAERGWTAEQAARLLRCARIAVTDEQLEAWLRPGGDAYQQSQGRAVLTALLQRVAGQPGYVPRWFSAREFGTWVNSIHPALLFALDALRDMLGSCLVISPAAGSLGRRLGGSKSLHNVDVFGMVYAADVLLPLAWGVGEGFEAARDLRLFSGIGVYPFWKPRPGLHLDVRHLSAMNPTKGATPLTPATWGAVRGAGGRQEYVSVGAALARFEADGQRRASSAAALTGERSESELKA